MCTVSPRKVKKHRLPRPRGAALAALVIGTVLSTAVAATAVSLGGGPDDGKAGSQTAQGILLPDNQRISPLGHRLLVGDGRLLASTLSPDGKRVAALTYEPGTGFLTILDPASGTVVQQVGTGLTAADPRVGDGTAASDPPLYSADGRTLWFPQQDDLLKFSVNPDGTVCGRPVVVALPNGGTGAPLPDGLALSPDGSTLYVALNGLNTLGVLDTATDTLVKQIPVGVAPRQVVLDGGTAYVSDEGGRPTTSADTSTNLTDGTPVVSDPSTGGVTDGTVSLVDLASGTRTGTLRVGLQPTALYLHGSALFVANSNDDSVSVIDTRSRRVTQTLDVNPLPGSSEGSHPNALTFTDAHHLLVSLGRDNALAEYYLRDARTPARYEGLIPTDWYPVSAQYDAALRKVVVTNDRGIGARGPESTIGYGTLDPPPATGHNTYDDTGSLTVFTQPSQLRLGELTHQVFVDNDWEHLLSSGRAAGSANAAASVVPEHIGDPSKIQHVFLIVKENRTYDQVLGDVGKGDSDPALAQFSRSVTPNSHALADRFGLFDNFYDPATLSADGHNWLVQADVNDYVEREFGTFYRSYPSQGDDALAYQRDGFLWNAAARAGRTVRDFGEYAAKMALPATGAPSWSQWYRSSRILEGEASGPLPVRTGAYPTTSDVPSVNAINDSAYPGFDTDIPDQYRADIWLQSFRQSEKTGRLADLTLMTLPQDHTAGISGTDPYPTAMVADNDLALGRIVDTISHSAFWKDSAVFVLEDDSQNGTDHVDGHRAPLWVISPYARRGAVIDTYYSQINVVRTIEQILGIQPMNQEDRAAEPMWDAFTSTPDLTPYTVLPNTVPLDHGLNTSAGAQPTGDALSALPAHTRQLIREWATWSAGRHTGGSRPRPDSVNAPQLNRLDWYQATGWTRPYPGDSAVLGPDGVPGREVPAQDIG
jgi:YVTN family beta-propeller protein